MRAELHPAFIQCKISCTSCGTTFETKGTVAEIKTELCSNCHPFYSGKQMLIDTTGQVERFKNRVTVAEKRQAAAPKKKAAPTADAKPKEEEHLSNDALLKKVREQLTQEAKLKKGAAKKTEAAAPQA